MTDISLEAVENVCRGLILIGGEQVLPFVEITISLRAALDAAEGRVTVKPAAYLHTRDDGQSKELVLAERVNSGTAQRRLELGWVSVPLYLHPPTLTTQSDKIAEAAGMDVFGARRVIDAYDAANPFRAADMHPAACHCHRCAIDWLRALAGRE